MGGDRLSRINEIPSDAESPSGGGAWLVGALLCGAALASWEISARPLILDEHVAYWIAGADNPGNILTRSLDDAATPPASSLLQRVSVGALGKTPFAMRLPSVLSFLGAIVVTFFVARELFDERVGAAAAMILAWHPEALDWMRVARPYGLSVCLAACSLWCTVRWIRAPRSIMVGLAWLLAAAGLLWTHYLNALLVGCLVVSLCFGPALRFRLSGVQFVILVGLCGAAIPLLPAVLRMNEWSEFLDYRDAPPPLWDMVGPMWWCGLPAGVAVATLMSRRREAESIPADVKSVLVMAGWSLLPILLLTAAAIEWSASLGELRYRVVFAPASSVLLASLVGRRSRGAALACGVGVLLVGSWWAGGNVPWRSQLLAAPAAGDWRALAEHVSEHGEPEQPLFVHSGLIEGRLVPALAEDPVFMDYVACRLGRFYLPEEHPRIALPWVWSLSKPLSQTYGAALDEARSHDGIVWVAAGKDTDLARSSSAAFLQFARQRGFQEAARLETDRALLVQLQAVR